VFRAKLAGTGRPLAATAALAVAVSACGSSSTQRVIARVGDTAITASALEHWTAVMKPAGAARPQGRRGHEEVVRAAERRLIDDDWLTSEAAALGAPVTSAAVARGMERTFGSPEGRAQYHALLTIGHYTPADARLEIRTDLAAQAIRRYVSAYSQAVSEAQVRSYYDSHLAEFHREERRDIDEVGELDGPVRPRQILEEVKHGVPFSSLSTKYELERTNFSVIPMEKRIMFLAAFRAKLGVLVGPLIINTYEFLFKVTRIEAPRTLSLAEARASIVSTLSKARHAQILAHLTSGLTAETSCLPGHVTQGCRQFDGPRAPGSVLEVPPLGLLETSPPSPPE
jgi:hypothetical protein